MKQYFAIGATVTSAPTFYCHASVARSRAASTKGVGYVWMWKHRARHWRVVANYRDGVVYNGLAQCVVAAPDPHTDWLEAARGI